MAALALGAGLRRYVTGADRVAAASRPDAEVALGWSGTAARAAVYALLFYLVVFSGAATQSFIYQQF